MARYVQQFSSALAPNQIGQAVQMFYAANGFQPYTYKGEQWYKKGAGFLMAPQIMRIHINGQLVTVEAFTRFALLPGVYLGEIDLDSFFGAVPNSALKSKINNLISTLYPTAPAQRIYNFVPQMLPQKAPVQAPVQQQIPVQQAPAGVCPSCSTQNAPDASFCRSCGNRLK